MSTCSFFDIADKYKAILLDSYGVLKNHTGLIDGVQNTVEQLRDAGKIIRILTNDASRSQQQQVDSFARLGLTGIEPHEIITSAMLAKHFLEKKIASGKVAYLGTENSAVYVRHPDIDTIPVSEIDLDNMDDFTAFVFLDDEGFDWNTDISKTVNILRRQTMPIIIANTDKIYPVAKDQVSVATGGIAQLVASMLSKRFINFGKPDSQMFMFAYEQINKDVAVDKNEILMVGDTLHTDILGGNKFGVQTMLVLTGNTREDNVDMHIRSSGIIPDYICNSILK